MQINNKKKFMSKIIFFLHLSHSKFIRKLTKCIFSFDGQALGKWFGPINNDGLLLKHFCKRFANDF